MMDQPLRYWSDAYTQSIVEAEPGSPLFRAFVDLAIRTEMDRPDDLIASADVKGLLDEIGVHWHDVGLAMSVPPMYIYAIMRGWHRLGPRGLALLAETLGVPIARFFLDEKGAPRMDVRRYAAYRRVAPRVTILGGG